MTPAVGRDDGSVRRSSPFFFPVVTPILVAFLLAVLALVALIELGAD